MSTEIPEIPEKGPNQAPPATDPAPASTPPPAFSPPPAINPAIFSSVAAAKPRARVTLTSILLAAAAVVAVAGIAFAVGRVTAPATTANSTGFGRAFNGGAGANGANGGFPGANGGTRGGLFGGASGGIELRGTVTAVNGDTLTVQLQNGQTVKVQTSASTTYHTQVTGSVSDVASGKSVIVQVDGGGLRGLFGQGGTGSATVPALDVTVTGS